MEGFAKMVEDGQKDSPCDRSNALRILTEKLKHLKNDIRVWNKTKGNSNRDAKAQLKLELEAVDLCIDNGNVIVEDIKRRGEIVNKLQDIDKLHVLEMAQKAKVRWAVEGDENSSFFHDQKRDLEGEVTNDEIKKVVWDCGTDKASGPDGFTFGIDLKKFMRFKVGNGENIMFWEDTWNDGGKCKCRFPRMYALESCKSITVGRKLAQSSLIDSFRRSPRGGAEQQQYNDLEVMVTATILAPMSDRLVWSLESSEEFTVASVWKLIDDNIREAPSMAILFVYIHILELHLSTDYPLARSHQEDV
nr:RNA-directed DNA polymerase, eukaryota, reverse transcriptase zinc-binding domain protein [Tanacetum cinerariifolium]